MIDDEVVFKKPTTKENNLSKKLIEDYLKKGGTIKDYGTSQAKYKEKRYDSTYTIR
jgi:hypothetical protein